MKNLLAFACIFSTTLINCGNDKKQPTRSIYIQNPTKAEFSEKQKRAVEKMKNIMFGLDKKNYSEEELSLLLVYIPYKGITFPTWTQ